MCSNQTEMFLLTDCEMFHWPVAGGDCWLSSHCQSWPHHERTGHLTPDIGGDGGDLCHTSHQILEVMEETCVTPHTSLTRRISELFRQRVEVPNTHGMDYLGRRELNSFL